MKSNNGQDIGIDLVKIERFREKVFSQNKSFYKKIFTNSEIAYCEKFSEILNIEKFEEGNFPRKLFKVTAKKK